MPQIAIQQIAFTEGELPLALGISRRAAKALARELGVRIGARRVVPVDRLRAWLDDQAAKRRTNPAAPGVAPPNEFQIASTQGGAR